MRTYSEIQEERVMEALEEELVLNINVKFSIRPQELLQLARFLDLDEYRTTKAALGWECIDLTRRVAVAQAKTKPSLAEAIVKLYECGLIDRIRFDLLKRLQEDRL